MTYTSKLRLLILCIALIPPLVTISILKFSTEQKIESAQIRQVQQSFKKAEAFIMSEQGSLSYDVTNFVNDSSFIKFMSKKTKKKKAKLLPSYFLKRYNFSYLYILDSSGRKLFSDFQKRSSIELSDKLQAFTDKHLFTKENDSQGDHAAFTYIVKIDSSRYVYAGRYIDQTMQYLLSNIADASVSIQFDNFNQLASLEVLHETKIGYQAVLLNSYDDSYFLTLDFQTDNSSQLYLEVLKIISVVTVCMTLIVIFVGLYLTRRTKKEIDNLRSAFASVANGDFDTTVMAYEKSEFSELADSFSEMVTQLKTTQTKLSTSEKIAAWETVGRKLAHEIKNPLTPISIAADDLRSSYHEKLPNFEKTLDESTSTIKKEVKRMTLLLDEFVSFARMKQSDLHKQNFSEFVYDLQNIYSNEIKSQKLLIKSDVNNPMVNLDKDTFTQLCINLIKNGFESDDNAQVTISIKQMNKSLEIIIADTGPGFTESKLEDTFRPFDTTKENGSGLGLIICHRIILDHNGTMVLQNSKDGGGEVVLTLPII